MSNPLQIDDPLNPHNNVAKSSFKFEDIKISFNFTYNMSFIGCYCDCHNDKMHLEDVKQLALLDDCQVWLDAMGRRPCDSVLSRVIYSYMHYMAYHS